MIDEGTPHPDDTMEEILECLEKIADKKQPAPVVNVTIPAPVSAAPAIHVAPSVAHPCIPVAYTILITARDSQGRISSATLTPVSP
jgi:hypothetical protein